MSLASIRSRVYEDAAVVSALLEVTQLSAKTPQRVDKGEVFFPPSSDCLERHCQSS